MEPPQSRSSFHRLIGRQGIAASVVGSIFDLPEIAGVDEIFAEVEQGNTAGVRLVCAAGLVPEAGGTADEGFDRFVVRRDLSSVSGQKRRRNSHQASSHR
jgi:hypothetical protein